MHDYAPPPALHGDPALAYGFRYMQGASPQFDAIGQVERQAANIADRQQLTAWVKGPLRALIPHQKAILGLGQTGYAVPRLDYAHTVDFAEDYFASLHSNTQSLTCPVMQQWHQKRAPQIFVPTSFDRMRYEHWHNNLTKHEIHNGIFDASVEYIDGRMCFIKLFNVSMPLEGGTNILTQFVTPLLAKIWTQIDAHDVHTRAIRRRPSLRTGPPLTPAEREIIPWLRKGKTNSEIGQILGKSELTIKTQIQHMLKKTGLQNRHALAASEG
jgi:DNA-binding CsgD family transcriptional regulator